ncbi:hypothetical protein HPB48_023338 [Haemaphysalis longicornis]|uniref:Uncharacterized protein n=1 Tax=Haemaphysalis longicornis TaxID=44386 RepID=A0A9J6H7A7_HAELO|nr:hypothetical protein HPB48_023338 [Haemaphysalis longicornis]
MPKRKRCSDEPSSVTSSGNASLPDDVTQILQKGPKYSLEPALKKHVLLAMVRRVGERAEDQERERATRDAVDTLLRTASTKPVVNPPFKKMISAFRQNDLSIVQADKEGGFVILLDGNFREKALGATQKNFKTVAFYPKKQKSKALKLLADLNIDSLRNATSKVEAELLELFLTGKTHKPECPFRVIVSGKSTWQSQVGHYLQRHLQQLRLDDPFLV